VGSASRSPPMPRDGSAALRFSRPLPCSHRLDRRPGRAGWWWGYGHGKNPVRSADPAGDARTEAMKPALCGARSWRKHVSPRSRIPSRWVLKISYTACRLIGLPGGGQGRAALDCRGLRGSCEVITPGRISRTRWWGRGRCHRQQARTPRIDQTTCWPPAEGTLGARPCGEGCVMGVDGTRREPGGPPGRRPDPASKDGSRVMQRSGQGLDSAAQVGLHRETADGPAAGVCALSHNVHPPDTAGSFRTADVIWRAAIAAAFQEALLDGGCW